MPSTWTQACLPLKMGGLGLRTPVITRHAARLASLINLQETLADMGGLTDDFHKDMVEALDAYKVQRGAVAVELPRPGRDAQASLTHPLYVASLAAFQASTTGCHATRLASVSTPHATAWTLGTCFAPLLSTTEFRAGLKWILGEPIAARPFPCPHCGATVDVLGTHLVTCTHSGDISRGHYLLRDVVCEAAATAGFTTLTEVSLPGRPDLIPADILITGPPLARPTAVDFGVQTTTRASAPTGQEVRDLAAAVKKRRYLGPCQKAGWAFIPFITDTYGAASAAGRSLTRKITHKFRQAHGDEQTYLFATKIHHRISEASVARAAIALARPLFTPLMEQHPGIVTPSQPGAASSTVAGSSGSEQGATESFRVRVRYAGEALQHMRQSDSRDGGEPVLDPTGAVQRSLFWEDRDLGARVWTR